MLMEQDPVHVFSPWSSFNIGSSLQSKENNLLNESDVFFKKNIFNNVSSNTSSYRHSDSSSPMSWSEVDNTSTSSRLSGIYDNGFSQDISNLWNKTKKDNSGNLGLDHLKELASKDLSSCNNLFERDNEECNGSLNTIINCPKSIGNYNSNFYDSSPQNDGIPLIDLSQVNTDNTLLRNILLQPDSQKSSNESSYLSFLGAENSYGLNDLSTLELSLATTNNDLSPSFNTLPSDPNAQKNFIENLKKLSELTSEINLNPTLDQTTPHYDGDRQFSPKDQNMSQNLLAAGYDAIFYSGIDSTYCRDKILSNCNASKGHFETSVKESRNTFPETMLPARQDHSLNSFLLSKNESTYRPPLYQESNVKNNATNVPSQMIVDKVLCHPDQKVTNNCSFMPNAETENCQDGFGIDQRNSYGLSNIQTASTINNTETLFQSNIPSSEKFHKESNPSYMPPDIIRKFNAGKCLLNQGVNADNSYVNIPPFPMVPPSLNNANDVTRPLRPYPPPSVEFCPPRQSLNHQLRQCIYDCYDQLNQLESEKKETEVNLQKIYLERKFSSINNLPIPRLPPSPSRVDRLIIDNFREHSKVVALISFMQDCKSGQFHPAINKAVASWHVAILQVQEIRNRETISAFNCIGFTPANKYNYDTHSLLVTIPNLAKACSSARTALFCAFTLTTLKYDDQASEILPTEIVTVSDEDDQDPFDFILQSRASPIQEPIDETSYKVNLEQSNSKLSAERKEAKN